MFLPGRAGVNPTPRIWACCPGLSPRCCGIAIASGLDHSAAMTPLLATDPALWPSILALLREAFAYMEGRIDPPSSLRDLTPEALSRQAEVGEIWVIGAPVACVFLTPKPGVLYVGKLAVAAGHRGQGLARRLMDVAELRAQEMGLPALELQTRVELVENQAAFRAMGFHEVGWLAHTGFDRPTSITYRRPVF
jgi:ribosomal protein S18 acetylase RimI-like enzyme